MQIGGGQGCGQNKRTGSVKQSLQYMSEEKEPEASVKLGRHQMSVKGTVVVGGDICR